MVLVGAFIVSLLFGSLDVVFGGLGVGRNLTDFMRHREKRSLIFENGGTAQVVIGPIFPIQFADPIVWRSMICSYNLHVSQFKIIDKPFYPWDKWENVYARSDGNSPDIQPDSSRELVYQAIEYYLTKTHGHGRECLLRAICENAQVDHYMDIFGEVLNVILTPGKEDMDPVYSEAFGLGKSGIDCVLYYSVCPKGLSFLDRFIDDM